MQLYAIRGSESEPVARRPLLASRDMGAYAVHGCALLTSIGTSTRPPSLFEADYLTIEHTKIYVGWSRHWAVVWLWFLS
ncbi:hypothetical protein ACWGH2_14880 [Streptomyces sp. NPDC054871]